MDSFLNLCFDFFRKTRNQRAIAMMTQNPKAPITVPTINTVMSSDELVDSEIMSEGVSDVEEEGASEVDASEVSLIVVDDVEEDEVEVADECVEVPVAEEDVVAIIPVVEVDGGPVSHL
jgi:hypothetical protein